MRKIKLFTHTDLDGVGCYIVMRSLLSEEYVIDVEYCNYHEINGKVEEFLWGSSCILYEKIFITDISINEDTVSIIEQDEVGSNIVLLDHHKTAEWLNKYDWATVTEFDKELNENTCGAYMLYEYLMENLADVNNLSVGNFADIVRKYDTWLWHTKYKEELPKKIDNLLKIKGRDIFIKDMINKLSYGGFLLQDSDIELLEIEQRKIDEYVELKNENILEYELENGYKMGVVIAENRNYISELGNRLSEMNLQYDLICMINLDNRTMSFRTSKNDVDVSEVAKTYQGGGHPKSAGSPLDKDIAMYAISKLL